MRVVSRPLLSLTPARSVSSWTCRWRLLWLGESRISRAWFATPPSTPRVLSRIFRTTASRPRTLLSTVALSRLAASGATPAPWTTLFRITFVTCFGMTIRLLPNALLGQIRWFDPGELPRTRICGWLSLPASPTAGSVCAALPKQPKLTMLSPCIDLSLGEVSSTEPSELSPPPTKLAEL